MFSFTLPSRDGNYNLCRACVCVCLVPGCCYNGGVEASIARQSHSYGDRPGHHTKSVICKCLEIQRNWFRSCNFDLYTHNVLSKAGYRLYTHYCHCITGHYRAHVQNSIIGHIGQNVDDGDNGHRDGNGQGQVPVTKGHTVDHYQVDPGFMKSALLLVMMEVLSDFTVQGF